MKQIKIYTDGGVSPKNGVGGWGVIILYPNNTEVVISGSFKDVTNNQMEIWAVIEALSYIAEKENLNHVNVEVVSDSRYIVDGVGEWLQRWKSNGWKSRTGPVKNKPLWQAIDNLVSKMQVKFTWVRGHNGDEYNERVDKLAVGAYQKVIKDKERKKKK